MTITMDKAGRLVIPKEIRKEAGLEPGALLDVRCNEGVIEIQPRTLPVRLEKRGRALVAVPVSDVPVVKNEAVQGVIDELRNHKAVRRHK